MIASNQADKGAAASREDTGGRARRGNTMASPAVPLSVRRAASTWQDRARGRPSAKHAAAMEAHMNSVREFERASKQAQRKVADIRSLAEQLDATARARVDAQQTAFVQQVTTIARQGVRSRNRDALAAATRVAMKEIEASVDADKATVQRLARGDCFGVWVASSCACMYEAWGECAMALRWVLWYASLPCRLVCRRCGGGDSPPSHPGHKRLSSSEGRSRSSAGGNDPARSTPAAEPRRPKRLQASRSRRRRDLISSSLPGERRGASRRAATSSRVTGTLGRD